MTTSTEEFLAHHGVKGMKWGIRHDRNGRRISSAAAKRRAAATSTAILKRARGTRSSDIKKLSDEELQKRLRRLNMERQYKSLAGKGVDKATADFVKEVGKNAAKTAITAAVTAQAAAIIKKTITKG